MKLHIKEIKYHVDGYSDPHNPPFHSVRFYDPIKDGEYLAIVFPKDKHTAIINLTEIRDSDNIHAYWGIDKELRKAILDDTPIAEQTN